MSIDIKKIIEKYSIPSNEYEMFGNDSIKIKPNVESFSKPNGKKLILITAMNATPSGEGKTTIAIALNDAMNLLNDASTILCLRQPSIGPTLGFKGGANGGGKVQIVPKDLIDLGLNGDAFIIETINNLISSMIDNSIYWGNEHNIDLNKIVWKRVIDISDRSLRDIKINIDAKKGLSYNGGFDITAASEIMTIFCLSKTIDEMIERINNIIVAYTKDNQPVYARVFHLENSIRKLMERVFKPNGVFSLNNNLCLMHGGPFANIAHGCNTIIALNTALKYGKYVITEAGFGSDLGMEKFIDIVGQQYMYPDCVVIACSLRSIIQHSNKTGNEIEDIKLGLTNLQQHINNIKAFGVNFVVAINKFTNDSEESINFLSNWLNEQNIPFALCDGFNLGAAGAVDLAKKVIEQSNKPCTIKPIYKITDTLENKIKSIVNRAYGLHNIVYLDQAKEKLVKFNNLPYYVCMAKTPLSLSTDPKNLIYNPEDEIVIQDIIIANGAQLIIPICQGIFRMPGLPKQPNASK